MKVLITRTDRLGDLVLSLPVLAELQETRPDWTVHAMVAPDSVPLVENDPAVASIWTWSGDADDGNRAELTERLRAEGYDAAVMLLYDRALAGVLRRAGIPRRYGPLSKWSSWLVLNRGSWQSRSRGHRHEMDHNLRLVRRLTGGWRGGRGVRGAGPEPRLHLSQGQKLIGNTFRRDEAPGARVVAFVHPGSGGSALDWEPARFAEVANELARRQGWRVFVTGAGSDREAVTATVAAGLDPGVTVLLDRYPLREFLGVLGSGDLFVGPSTGPLHMAAALGLATVGVYPPVPAMSPARWGQRGRWNQALVPAVRCPGRRVCLEHRCSLYNCLSGILAIDVLDAALAVVRERNGAPAERS